MAILNKPSGSQSGQSGLRPGPLQRVPFHELLLILIISLLAQRFLPMIFVIKPEPGSLSAGSPNGPDLTAGLLFLLAHSIILMSAIYLRVIRKHGLRLADLGIVLASRTWALRAAIFGVLAVPAVSIINIFIQNLMQRPLQNPQIDVFASGGFSLAALFASLLLAAVIVPLVEEIAFRGLFYGWLRGRMPLAPSLAISSVVFASLHGVTFLIPSLAVVGVILALVMEKSGSVLISAITHGCFNAINLVLLYLVLYSGWMPPGAAG